MNQGELWHDSIFDALGTAVNAVGGRKAVAGRMWPNLDATSGAARITACINPDHAQKLCPSELVLLARLAKDAGDHSIMTFLARELGYEVKPLSGAEAKKRAKKVRRAALLAELAQLLEDD